MSDRPFHERMADFVAGAWVDGKLVRAPSAPATPKPARRPPCRHLGKATGQTVPCPGCAGTVRIKLYGCEVYGTCTLRHRLHGHGCCDAACQSYTPRVSV